jgi:hypothetical protein
MNFIVFKNFHANWTNQKQATSVYNFSLDFWLVPAKNHPMHSHKPSNVPKHSTTLQWEQNKSTSSQTANNFAQRAPQFMFNIIK